MQEICLHDFWQAKDGFFFESKSGEWKTAYATSKRRNEIAKYEYIFINILYNFLLYIIYFIIVHIVDSTLLRLLVMFRE